MVEGWGCCWVEFRVWVGVGVSGGRRLGWWVALLVFGEVAQLNYYLCMDGSISPAFYLCEMA